MLFCKLLLSPLPHARVKHLDVRQALAMPGMKAILTADELPPPADTLTDNGTVIHANPKSERGLNMEPLYQVNRFSPSPQWTNSLPLRRLKRFESSLSRCPSPSIRLRPCAPEAPIRERTETSGCSLRRRRPWRELHPRPRRLPRSECLSGPKRTSRSKRKAVCRWGRRPTNGRTVTSRRGSKAPRWSSMKRSSHPTRATRRSRPAVPWLTGGTERFTFTPGRRAPLKPCLLLRDG